MVALFDTSEEVIGRRIAGLEVLDMNTLEQKLDELGVHIAILTLPKQYADEVVERLESTGVKGIWNFTGKELNIRRDDMVAEDVHLGDSLMALCYEIAKNKD